MAHVVLAVLALFVAAPGPAYAERDAGQPQGLELVGRTTDEPELRLERARALRESTLRLEAELAELNTGGGTVMFVLGTIGIVGGVATGLALGLSAICIASFYPTCNDVGAGHIAGIVGGAIVAAASIVLVISGVVINDEVRTRRGQQEQRLRDERRELELLEAVGVAVDDQAVLLAVGGRF